MSYSSQHQPFLQLHEPEAIYLSGESSISLIGQIRTGFSFKDMLAFSDTIEKGLSDFSTVLQVSLRTLQRYNEDKKLNQPQSERLWELSKLYGHGYSVFDSRGAFNQWMDTPNPLLGGVTPFSLLDTHAGLEMVNNLIGRIEHGVYS
ncbi:MAG: DUF2384 domain-containing protein [Cyclobacteriaceae bacterium]|nr:DUF2384 domain-containing protein [Cyclobacteriaceae bacterium]